MRYDLVIRGGTVVDGSGGKPFISDVAVADGKFAALGETLDRGLDEIDAKGALVTPGFIDIHTHYDGQLTWTDRMLPSSQHGVTTVVTGNCGVGFAPCREGDRDRLIRLMEGVEDIPEVVLASGLSWKWESFPQFLDLVGRSSYDVDVAPMIPHAALRVFVMGDRGVRREPAHAADREQLKELTREALQAGAIGFGTSRSLNHRTLAGELIPTLGAEKDELVAIASAFREVGRGVLQIILPELRDGAEMDFEFGIVRAMAEASGRPVSFSLNQRWSDPQAWRRLLKLTERANADGLAIRAQVMGRPIGAVLGHEVSLNPFSGCPTYQGLLPLTFEERIQRLACPEIKTRILAEVQSSASTIGETRFERIYPLSDPPDYEPHPDESIASRALRAGMTAHELAYDMLLQRSGRQLFLLMALNYAEGSLQPAYEMLVHPHTVPGLGDGGAHCGIICDASVTTSMLTHWTRDRTRGPRLSVPQAVRALTLDCAAALGLSDRGRIAVGYKADFNVIDYEALRLHLPSVSYDLPAGGRRLHQKASGYVATGVKGQITYRSGEQTGALPGRLVRIGR